MNKIENAISDLYINALSPSEIVEGEGINISQTKDKKLEFSVAENILRSDSCSGIEVSQGHPSVMDQGKLYFILDPDTKKLAKIMINGVAIYEVE